MVQSCYERSAEPCEASELFTEIKQITPGSPTSTAGIAGADVGGWVMASSTPDLLVPRVLSGGQGSRKDSGYTYLSFITTAPESSTDDYSGVTCRHTLLSQKTSR